MTYWLNASYLPELAEDHKDDVMLTDILGDGESLATIRTELEATAEGREMLSNELGLL